MATSVEQTIPPYVAELLARPELAPALEVARQQEGVELREAANAITLALDKLACTYDRKVLSPLDGITFGLTNCAIRMSLAEVCARAVPGLRSATFSTEVHNSNIWISLSAGQGIMLDNTNFGYMEPLSLDAKDSTSERLYTQIAHTLLTSEEFDLRYDAFYSVENGNKIVNPDARPYAMHIGVIRSGAAAYGMINRLCQATTVGE